MTRYIIRRLLIAVPVLWGIITLTFIMSEIMPGDYVDALVPPGLRLQMGGRYSAIAEAARVITGWISR